MVKSSMLIQVPQGYATVCWQSFINLSPKGTTVASLGYTVKILKTTKGLNGTFHEKKSRDQFQ